MTEVMISVFCKDSGVEGVKTLDELEE